MKQSIKSLRCKPTFPHYFQHTLVLTTDRRLSTYANQSKVLLTLPAELWALSQFLIAHTVAQGFSRYLQISGDTLGWVPVLIAGNIWFTSTNGGARGKTCFKALVTRAEKIGWQQRYGDALGISAPELGSRCVGTSRWPGTAMLPLLFVWSATWPMFQTLPFLKSTQHNW